MKSVAPLFQAAMEAHEAKLPEWHEPDPREDWRCGTCAYWRIWEEPQPQDWGMCHNPEVDEMLGYIGPPASIITNATHENFGCRFWSAKPLEDKGAHIPIASHNEG